MALTSPDPRVVTERPRRRGPYPEPITVERRRIVGEHTHRQPRWPTIILSVLVILTAAAVVVLAFYVVDLTATRDEQTEDTREQIREAVCDVLDELRAGTQLDATREAYGCGPGRPVTPNPAP